MKKILFFITLLLASTLFLNSCTQSKSSGLLYEPKASDATAIATLSELQQGRALYINSCASCHSLNSPDDYAPENWHVIVLNMRDRAGINQAQTVLITKYLSRGMSN